MDVKGREGVLRRMIFSPCENRVAVFVQLEFNRLSLPLSEKLMRNEAIEQGVSNMFLAVNVDLIPSQVVDHRLRLHVSDVKCILTALLVRDLLHHFIPRLFPSELVEHIFL